MMETEQSCDKRTQNRETSKGLESRLGKTVPCAKDRSGPAKILGLRVLTRTMPSACNERSGNRRKVVRVRLPMTGSVFRNAVSDWRSGLHWSGAHVQEKAKVRSDHENPGSARDCSLFVSILLIPTLRHHLPQRLVELQSGKDADCAFNHIYQ